MGRSSGAAPAVEQPSLFVFGLGYVGTRLANRLVREGWRVSGSVRSLRDAASAADASDGEPPLDEGVQVVQLPDASLGVGDVQALLAGFRNVLFTAPVAKASGLDPFLSDPVVGTALRLAAQDGQVHWAGYLSTTSVYGDHGGAWVDEDTALMPGLRRGEQRLRAEQAWLFESGLPMHVFRLPGIYGPGRGPIAKAAAGSARCVVKQGQVFSRAHVDDICGAVAASMLRPNPGRAYNITDDEPAPSHEVNAMAYQLLGKPAPALEDFEEAKAGMSKMTLTFFAECKRVSNKRMKEELGYEPLYPTYREGMVAQLEEEIANGWTVIDEVAPEMEVIAIGDDPSGALGASFSPRHARRPGTPGSAASRRGFFRSQSPAAPAALAAPAGGGKPLPPPWGAFRSMVDWARWVWERYLRPWAARVRKTCVSWSHFVAEYVLGGLSSLAASAARGTRGRAKQTTLLLMDNGSLSLTPFLQLRQHAARLERALAAEATGATPAAAAGTAGALAEEETACAVKVIAVSARFSDRLDPAQLGGEPGLALESMLQGWAATDKALLAAEQPTGAGADADAGAERQQQLSVRLKDQQVVVVPFFLGPSDTAVSFAPKVLEKLCPALRYRVARPLVSRAGAVADLLCAMVLRVAERDGLDAPYAVVLVDHGSPARAVNATRRALAAQMRVRLGQRARCVVDCSMERREGEAYAFNDPLLENVFDSGGLGDGDVVLAMGFLAPGRHAGAGGDIAEILDAVGEKHPALRVHQTGLIGDPEANGDQVLDLLLERVREVRRHMDF